MGDWFAKIGMEQVIAVGSALLALASFILNLRIVDRQEKRNAASLKMAYDSDIIGWSNEVIETLAGVQEIMVEKGVSYGDAEFPRRRSEARARLSALIDRGRLFFPNRTDTAHGADKEAAYRGHRHAALDTLVNAYAVIDKAGGSPGPDSAAIEELRKLRRAFVAEVFQAVDPVRRGQKIRELAA